MTTTTTTSTSSSESSASAAPLLLEPMMEEDVELQKGVGVGAGSDGDADDEAAAVEKSFPMASSPSDETCQQHSGSSNYKSKNDDDDDDGSGKKMTYLRLAAAASSAAASTTTSALEMAFGGGKGGEGGGVGNGFQRRRDNAATGEGEAADSLEEPLLDDDMDASTIPASGNQRQHQGDGAAGGDRGRQQQHRTTPRSASWREAVRKMGDYLACVTLLIMLILVPLALYSFLQRGQPDRAMESSARVMVAGTVVLSLRLVYLHLTHWFMPDVQKYVVRILWMVPIYSVQSCLSIRDYKNRVYYETIRDFYEAYVIASFAYYLIALLGGEESLANILESKGRRQQHHNPPSDAADEREQQQREQEQQHQDHEGHGDLGNHVFPLNLFLEPWALGMKFLVECKHGVLQYVVFKIVSTIVIFLCVKLNAYGEGKFELDGAYLYLLFFQNCSVMYALYCLVKLYHAINEELRFPINWNPLGKFLCVKGVVFFTWWQGIVINFLRGRGYIKGVNGKSASDVADELINYCVVVEMIAFAIAHSYTFTYTEYLPSHISNAVSLFRQQQQQEQQQEQQQQPLLTPASDPNDSEVEKPQRPGANHNGGGGGGDDCCAAPLPASAAFARSESFLNDDANDDVGLAALPAAPQRSSSSSSSSLTSSIMKALSPPAPSRPTVVLPSYRPPATLDRPMRFKDAFWSSTVPKETIRDIKRLRSGVDSVVQKQAGAGRNNKDGVIQETDGSDNDEGAEIGDGDGSGAEVGDGSGAEVGDGNGNNRGQPSGRVDDDDANGTVNPSSIV